MTAKGYDIRICIPIDSISLIEEQMYWIKKNFGNNWVEKIIVTKDPTLIHADVHIDSYREFIRDKKWSKIAPQWKLLYIDYEHAYCNDITNYINWKNWELVLSHNLKEFHDEKKNILQI